MPQSTGWLSVTSCSISLRRARTLGESVLTRMPLAIGMLQAMSSQPAEAPSASTRSPSIQISTMECRLPLPLVVGRFEAAAVQRAAVLDPVLELVAVFGD